MKLVLIHAFPLDERMWEPQREALGGHDVVAPNLYDLGGNSVDGWADRILDDVMGDLAVVGASVGGYVGLAMARSQPERIRGLLLAGARAGADSPERRAARNEGIRKLREEGVEAWAPNAPAPPPPERTVDELVRTLEALRDRPDATDVVRGFPGPLWIAVGDADPFLPVDEAREIAASAPNGRLELFEGTGHFTNVEQPERFNELLREFVDAAS
ncbi:MAG TPA: alpha/beta hydrolase [Gaiellaceae bacterium]|nr:alpha/beta hydrolase [Gaiellaceae bacterium]